MKVLGGLLLLIGIVLGISAVMAESMYELHTQGTVAILSIIAGAVIFDDSTPSDYEG